MRPRRSESPESEIKFPPFRGQSDRSRLNPEIAEAEQWTNLLLDREAREIDETHFSGRSHVIVDIRANDSDATLDALGLGDLGKMGILELRELVEGIREGVFQAISPDHWAIVERSPHRYLLHSKSYATRTGF